MISRQIVGTAIGAGSIGLIVGLSLGAAFWSGAAPAAESRESDGPPVVRLPGEPVERAAPDWTRVTRGTLTEFWWQGRTWRKVPADSPLNEVDPFWRIQFGAEVFSATVPETRAVILYHDSGQLHSVFRQDLLIGEWMDNGEHVYVDTWEGKHRTVVTHFALGIPVGLKLMYDHEGKVTREEVHLGHQYDRFGREFYANGLPWLEWTSNWNSEASGRELNEDGTVKKSHGEPPETLIRALQHVLGPDSPLGKL